MQNDLIAIVGYGQVGKDTLAGFLEKTLLKKGVLARKESFATEVRNDLYDFLMEKLGISAFTEDKDEKRMIRPMLIAWGTDVMRNQIDIDTWVNRFQPQFEKNQKEGLVTFMTDLRFQNELDWVHENEGITIWLGRHGVGPLNDDEKKYTAPLRKKCIYDMCWPDFKDMAAAEPEILVEEFLKRTTCNIKKYD